MSLHIPEPVCTFQRARSFLAQAMEACERGHLFDAQDFLEQARRILETEQQFRLARHGGA